MLEIKSTKRCSKCQVVKGVSEFHKRPERKSGVKSHCKACRKDYAQSPAGRAAQKRYDQSPKGKAKGKRHDQSPKGKAGHKRRNATQALEHPERIIARNAVNNAVTAGKIPPARILDCSLCDNPAQEYHHHKGYKPDNYLDVIPVCRACHGKSEGLAVPA